MIEALPPPPMFCSVCENDSTSGKFSANCCADDAGAKDKKFSKSANLKKGLKPSETNFSTLPNPKSHSFSTKKPRKEDCQAGIQVKLLKKNLNSRLQDFNPIPSLLVGAYYNKTMRSILSSFAQTIRSNLECGFLAPELIATNKELRCQFAFYLLPYLTIYTSGRPVSIINSTRTRSRIRKSTQNFELNTLGPVNLPLK